VVSQAGSVAANKRIVDSQDESTCIIYLIKVGAYGTANGFEPANGPCMAQQHDTGHAIALGLCIQCNSNSLRAMNHG
jgi:hypothetical protein